MRLAKKIFIVVFTIFLSVIICAGAKTPEKEMKVDIKVGKKSFTATLLNNETAKQFANNMPFELDMSDLNANEKYYYLDENLKTNAKRVSKINNGDIMLYGSNCLVLFYKSFSSSYSYTNIGSIDDIEGFASALGKGDVKVSFSLKK